MPQKNESPWGNSAVGNLLKVPKETYQAALSKLGRLQNFTQRADNIAEQNFPDSARDASAKNAFRHALGTGMLTQELGGGAAGAVLAKMAGWGWEGLGASQLADSADHRLDTRHDLNANNIGASVATQVKNEAELVARLKQMANASVVAEPPGFFEPGVPRMTRAVK